MGRLTEAVSFITMSPKELSQFNLDHFYHHLTIDEELKAARKSHLKSKRSSKAESTPINSEDKDTDL